MKKDWVRKQWENAQLGDKRLTKRAIKVGESCLTTPRGTLPEKFVNWKDTKAAYRFFDSDQISHENLQDAHNKNVIEAATNAKQMVLFIQDGSELIYNSHRYTQGLGPTADAFGQEIMIHTCLAVLWEKECEAEVVGIAKQVAWVRPESEDGKRDKDQRDKESQVWLNTLKTIGKPPSGTRWVSVGDRGNDIYEYVEGATTENWKYVVRAKHDRILTVGDKKTKLHEWIRTLTPAAEHELDLRARGDKFSRKAKIKIAWGKALMPPPQGRSGMEIPVTYIRAYDAVDNELEWILVTSLPVESVKDAITVVQIYEKRWIIEEYHKCLKTGCRIEEAQLRTGKRILGLLGILGIIATQLLQLRDISRQQPERLAEDVISKEVIKVVKAKYKLTGPISVKEVWRRIAMLGGFLGRKSDGSPGWQTIWKGWLRIQDMLEGFALAKNCG